MNPLNEEEEIARIEGADPESFEEGYVLSEKQRLVLEASRTLFWEKVLIPELNNDIAYLDARLTTEVDPWRRYATVEAYKFMSNFKLKLIDALEKAQRSVE